MKIRLFDYTNDIDLNMLIHNMRIEKIGGWIPKNKVAIFAHHNSFYPIAEKLEKQGFAIYDIEPEFMGASGYKNGNEITIDIAL